MPAAEVANLEGDAYDVQPQIVTGGLQAAVPAEIVTQSEVVLEFARPAEGTSAYLEFTNAKGDVYQIGYDGQTNKYFSDRRKSGNTSFSDKFASTVDVAPRSSSSDMVKMRVFMDHDSAELFADDGATVMTESLFPREPFTVARFIVHGQPVNVSKFEVTELKSIH